jgi:hypothetical protein
MNIVTFQVSSTLLAIGNGDRKSPVSLSYVSFKAVLKASSGHIIKLTKDFCHLAQQCCLYLD